AHGLGAWSRACLASSRAWVCASACSGVIPRLRGRLRGVPALPDAAPGAARPPFGGAEPAAALPRLATMSFAPPRLAAAVVPVDLVVADFAWPVVGFFAACLVLGVAVAALPMPVAGFLLVALRAVRGVTVFFVALFVARV